MKKHIIPATSEYIDEGLGFIEDTLKAYRYKGKKLKESLDVCRAELTLMVEYANEGADIQIGISRWYSIVTVELYAKGQEFQAEGREFQTDGRQFEADQEHFSHRSQSAMEDLYKTSNADNVSRFHRNQYNHTKIHLGDKERVFAFRTMSALCMAIVFSAFVLLFLPDGAVDVCINYVLNPIQTLFLNILRLVTAPAVFFSIMTAVAKFASFKDLERVGKKTIAGHIISAVLAVLLGVVLFCLFQPSAKISGALSSMVVPGGRNSSILDTVVNSVPDNIISPFLNVDALQLLVLASLCGLALAKVGKESKILSDVAEALHRFCSTLVDIVTLIIPIAVFFVTTLMIFMFGFISMTVALHIFVLVVMGFVIMIILNVLSVGIVGGLNPLTFVKKMSPYMLQVFWSGSSVSKVRDTMGFCENELGISPKVHRFAVPFGAISNLDGNCLYMTIVGLYLTQLCGIDILGQDFITVAFMVMVLSIGSAITPGSAMLALTMLMGQMGVSLKVICLVLGINALLEMFLAMSNNVREVASTLIIAGQENLLDKNTYKHHRENIE